MSKFAHGQQSCVLSYFMAEEKFKIRPNLKTGNPEIDLYLYELHQYLRSFETSSIKTMLVAIDDVAQKIVDDLVLVAEGDTNNLSILSDDKESKIFDKISKIVEKIESWKKVSDMAEALRPEEVEEGQTKKAQIKLDLTGNPFEQIQKEALDKRKNK